MLIHPSLIEKIALDPREYDRAVADDLKRSFAYVGPVSVSAREGGSESDPLVNELRLVVRMGRPYWSDEAPDGAQMWEAMHTWLAAKAYKVGATVANFNESRAEEGGRTVSYDRLVLDMKPYELAMALPQGDGLPALDELVARFRGLLATGVIPADARGVEMPSAASLAAQREEAKGAADASETARAAEVAVVAGEDGDDVQRAPAQDVPAGADEPSPEEGDASSGRSITADAPHLARASDGLASVEYAQWDVVLADGSTRELDSVSGTWL